MKLKRLLTTAAFVAAAWTGAAHAGDIVVSAAASLTNAFKDLAAQFEQAHPDSKVLPSFAASDVLLQQIVNGAPADIFASADQTAMDKAEQAGAVLPETRKDFARNEIVLIVPKDSSLNIGSVQDLGKEGVTRVAYGNPATVPVGRYTQAALEHAGSWDTVSSKQVLGQNVRQVLDYVARGEVDAGFVFATDAAVSADKVAVVQKIASPIPVLYPIALVKREGSSPDARAFQDFVLSEQGQAVLAKYGFAKP
jgi:molybdate transport system substrate-binding protein